MIGDEQNSPKNVSPKPKLAGGTLPLGGEVPVLVPEGLEPEAVARILQARARALAQVPPAEAAEGGLLTQVVVFALGQERYAVQATFVQGIYFVEDLTPVPGTPDFVVGVMNVRGRILSVLDIHRFMGLAGVEIDDDALVAVVHAAGLEVGILVSRVLQVRPLSLGELEPALPTATRIAAEYTRGITPDLLVLLDLEALLGTKRIIVQEKVG